MAILVTGGAGDVGSPLRRSRAPLVVSAKTMRARERVEYSISDWNPAAVSPLMRPRWGRSAS
jgi:hypothetical protein